MFKKISLILMFTVLCVLGLGAETTTLLIYPFENQGNPDYNWLSQGMTSTAISDLSAVESLNLISQTDRDKAMEELKLYLSGMLDEEKALKIGKWEGADYIFTGTFMVAGEGIRANAQVLDVERGTVETSVKIDGTMEEIFDFQDRIVLNLMAEAQRLRLGGITWNRLKEETRNVQENTERPTLSSYQLYSRGMEQLNEYPLSALKLFREALQRDPDYLEALIMAGHLENTNIRNYPQAAVNLNRAEELLKKRKETHSRRYLNLLLALCNIHQSRGDRVEARNYLDKAKSLAHLDPYLVLFHQGNFHREDGNYQSALESYAEAEEVLKSEEGFSYDRAALLLNIAITYNRKGSWDLAKKSLNNGLNYMEQNHQKQLPLYAELIFNRGNSYREEGEIELAIEDYERAVSLYRNLDLENTANFFIFLGNLGGLYGSYLKDWHRTGEILVEATERAERMGNTTHKDYGNYIIMASYAYYLAGDTRQAGPLFRKAYHYFIALNPNHPRAAELLEKAEELGY